jgi:hypothetical protein
MKLDFFLIGGLWRLRHRPSQRRGHDGKRDRPGRSRRHSPQQPDLLDQFLQRQSDFDVVRRRDFPGKNLRAKRGDF